MVRGSGSSRSVSGRGLAPRPGRAEPAVASQRAVYSAAERARLLSAWKSSRLTAEALAAREGMKSSSVLFAWQRAAKQGRVLADRKSARNPRGTTRRPYAEKERVAAVSAYRHSGLTQRALRSWTSLCVGQRSLR